MEACASNSSDMKLKYTNIAELPLDIQTMVLKLLSYKEIALLEKVSTHFSRLIKSEFGSLVKNVSTPDIFPNSRTVEALSRLSKQGNIEASIKLGIAHLYREGLLDTVLSRQQSSTEAAEYFCAMEKNPVLRSPITWVFIRPPWSNATICRKALVMRHFMKLIEDGDTHPHLYYCIGKVIRLFEDVDPNGMTAGEYFQLAAEAGLPHAMYELWKMELECYYSRRSVESVFSSLEPGNRLCLMRKLRRIAATGYKPAQVQLGRFYAMYQFDNWCSQYLFASKKFTNELFGNSHPLPFEPLSSTQPLVTSKMRLILIDWMIEVANLKDFSSETLHATVNCVDRYLRIRKICKTKLQLLGIASMVIFARKMEKDVLTIRESIWLTDSSYTYEEMVRMIEDIVSTLKGDLEVISLRDYLSMLLQLKCIDSRAKYISEFIADAVLLYDNLRAFSPSILASACLFLAVISVDIFGLWDVELINFTGFSKHHLVKAAQEIHKYCFLDNETSRDSRLSHVQERYNKTEYGETGIAGQIIASEELARYIKDDATAVLVTWKDLSCFVLNTKVSSTLLEDQWYGQSQQPSSAETTGHSSSDEDFEADTPPTLSCAYLVCTDTKARKRIHKVAQTNQCPLRVQENVGIRDSLKPLLNNCTAKKDKTSAGNIVKSPRPHPILEKENASSGKRSNRSRDHSVIYERAESSKSMRTMR